MLVEQRWPNGKITSTIVDTGAAPLEGAGARLAWGETDIEGLAVEPDVELALKKRLEEMCLTLSRPWLPRRWKASQRVAVSSPQRRSCCRCCELRQSSAGLDAQRRSRFGRGPDRRAMVEGNGRSSRRGAYAIEC